MTDLSIIPLKNNLQVDHKHNEVKNQIITRLNELQLIDSRYKCDAEFLALVCNLVEHLISKKDKIGKKQMVITVIDAIFPLSPEETELISKNIEFLHAQRGIIKKVSFYKLFKTGMREYFRKKG